MKNIIPIAATILAAACGGKDESSTEVKPELKGVSVEEIEPREDLAYVKGSDTLYTGKVFALYENGQKKSEGNFKGGKLDGPSVMWHKNGQKKSEGNFKDGKQEGLFVMWYENGHKEQEKNLKDGNLHGLSVGFYKNGQKRWKVNYKNGKKEVNQEYLIPQEFLRFRVE